ncbi:tetratricopeptide repeat protein [Winogradskyella eckloniae]|uniref:tetratricopeptide repeat protein n=1 Tax=Winogradskyella eckloniae TaxID=1089306 RepID=UPI001564118C|nr:tetratricopeptide repeat protein [Winogradskyella eckloniae]NRD19469.1 tetratricopeptide repeat protein [Winogradskyella eckloniae]
MISESKDYADRGNPQKSIELLTQALQLDSTHYIARYNRSTNYLNFKHYELALLDLQILSKTEPENDDLYYKISVCYNGLKDYTNTIAYLNKAIELQPNNDGYIKDRAGIYWTIEAYEKAQIDFNKIIELKPKNPEYYILRAFNTEELNDYESAILDYNRALKLDDEDYRTYYDRGNAYFTVGRVNKACTDWRTAIEKGDPRTVALTKKIKANCN